MTEMLIGAANELFINGITEKISSAKKNNEWKSLFVSTGKFFINNPDNEQSFMDDLSEVFCENNMLDISDKLKKQDGFSIISVLHNELYNLMIRYEIPVDVAESYIYYFTQIIITYLRENDFEKTLEMYLNQWKEKADADFSCIKEGIELIINKLSTLKNKEIKTYSIAEIDAQIRRNASCKDMSLDFFELDDEQFELQFENLINNKTIFIIGKSKEETLYRILNELRRKYPQKVVLVVKKASDWESLGVEAISDSILIPFFFAENIATIPNNNNIFIYGEDEPCYGNNKIQLHRRTKRNIVNALNKIGFEHQEAYNMVENTHGLYVALKKKLFDDAKYGTPEWVRKHSDTVIAALLCGKWTEIEGDKLIFEELAGKSYEQCKIELMNYTYGESPYIVKSKRCGESTLQLASIEDAWEELDLYISDEIWSNFIVLFYEILIESEPIFDYPFEKHFQASLYARKPEWSQTLKRGMIRTLIMRAYYRGHEENQREIDSVIDKILQTITTKERWAYIAQYMPDLCEASPAIILKRLEYELIVDTGLIELFSANDGDFITGRYYYTNILWAVEQLLQQKKYVKRVVDWLWKMNSFSIQYSISNSPKSILETIFSAWINVSVFSVEQKIEYAKEAIKNYHNAWDIISTELPSRSSSSVCATLNTPKYRNVDEPDILYVNEMHNTYIQYLYMCIVSAQ